MSNKHPNNHYKKEYDYLIAGGGIAGLYTAYHLVQQFPTAKICILEASNRLGGRLHSIHLESDSTIEAGGARFNTQQHRILSLIHTLGLDSKKIPITNDSKYIPIQPDYDPQLETFFPEIDDIIQKLQIHIHKHKIPDSKLIKTNLLELVHQIYSHQYPTIKKYLISRYPYYSELHSLNALEGLSLFTHEFASKTQYFILAGGLEQLITSISKQLEKHSTVDIYLNQPLETISSLKTISSNQAYIITSLDKQYKANKVILALPKSALMKIKFLTQKPSIRHLLNSIQTEPLYRIYARYPIDKKTGKVWFADLPKIVSNLAIKYIIPSNIDKGIIMISYTDSKFANYWFKLLTKGNDTLKKELSRELKLLFPAQNIPEPIWIKHYYWQMGAGYWKPGFSRKELIPKITKPFIEHNIFICNENYSSHQAWVEGSLESADYVLQKFNKSTTQHSSTSTRTKSKRTSTRTKSKQTSTSSKTKLQNTKEKQNVKEKQNTKDNKKLTKKMRMITIQEVMKHNKKTDAWIVINGKVADITEWIPKHPGGDIIMKGVGKDATKLFNQIGHDEYAKKMLKKYQIGVLI